MDLYRDKKIDKLNNDIDKLLTKLDSKVLELNRVYMDYPKEIKERDDTSIRISKDAVEELKKFKIGKESLENTMRRLLKRYHERQKERCL